jgi:TonB family protein
MNPLRKNKPLFENVANAIILAFMKTPIALILLTILSFSLSAQSVSKSSVLTDTTHIKKGDSAYTHVEIESEFPGGQKAWGAYLNSNLEYPKKAVRKNIQGTVVVQFIVEKDGKVSNVEVVRSVDPLLDQEAMRLILRSPNWKPAVLDGKKVRSYKKQPIVFQLVEENPKKHGVDPLNIHS